MVRFKVPEYWKICAKYSEFFPEKYHLLYQDNFLAHLLCHATYVTSFNMRSDPGVKFADLVFFIILARQSQKCKISISEIYFHISLLK